MISEDVLAQVGHCIFSRCVSGGAVASFNGCQVDFIANDTWDCGPDPYPGDAWNPPGENGNIEADPLFCDPDELGYYLCSDSPCAAENNPYWGQIGVYPVGCGASAGPGETLVETRAMDLVACPNPFSASVMIRVTPLVSLQPEARIETYTLDGRLVMSAPFTTQTGGGFFWKGADDRGRDLPSGVYLVRLVSSGRMIAGAKLVLAR
jgi:hypothetical protein